jgi:hypothetical protein
MASALGSKIEFTAAHEEIALSIGANVLALLIEQPGVADRTIVPPIRFSFLLGRWRFRSVHYSSEMAIGVLHSAVAAASL